MSATLRIALVVVLGACGAKAKPAEPVAAPVAPVAAPVAAKPAPSCEVALGGAIDRAMAAQLAAAPADQKAQATKLAQDMGPKMKAVVIKQCGEDHWAPEIVSCMNDAQDAPAFETCNAMLTDAQRKSVDKAMNDALSGH